MNSQRPLLIPRFRFLSLAACGTLALVATSARSQCVHELAPPPATHEMHANWGTSVALSGNGEVTLMGGPNADGGDGVVRPFTWNGSSWEEQPSFFPEPQFAYAAEFGWSVAASYDGNTAAVGAPGDIHGEFGRRSIGSVYVFTRDPATGEWTQQTRLVKPEPGSDQSFGQTIALSDSGDQLVVGQRNHIGSEWQQIPDSAWIYSRENGVWASPVELVGTDLSLADEFGAEVAISPDGQRAAVSANGNGMTDGRVFVFRREDAGWTVEQVLDHPEAVDAISWDGFGSSLALGNDVLMVGNPLHDDVENDQESTGAVFVFNLNGAEWLRQPDLIRLTFGESWAGFGHSLALRGDTLLVGAPRAYGSMEAEGAVHIVKRIGGKWTRTGVIRSRDPQENAAFGWSVALAGERAEFAIGERAATVEGMNEEGRVQFANAVSAPYVFEVLPGGSNITLTIRYLGFPIEIVVSPSGDIIGVITEDCDDNASAFRVSDLDLTVDDPVVYNLPPQVPIVGGAEVVVTNLKVKLAEAGAVELDENGLGSLAGALEISGRTTIGDAEPTDWDMFIIPGFADFQVTGGQGEPFEIVVNVATRELSIEVEDGLDYTVTARGNVAAKNVGQPSTPLGLAVCGMRPEGFCLSVTGTSGDRVVVEASPSLKASEWTEVHVGTLGEGPLEFIDPEALNHSDRYYRARAE